MSQNLHAKVFRSDKISKFTKDFIKNSDTEYFLEADFIS